MAKRNKKNSENTIELIDEAPNQQQIEDTTDWKDLYLRLFADFDNFKKRTQKEKQDIRIQVKIETLTAILDLDNDLTIARKNIEETEGLKIIFQKMSNFLKSQGIEEIQTTTYDSDLHEVISIIETGEEKIIDVVSKGYIIGDKPFRYPKIILSK